MGTQTDLTPEITANDKGPTIVAVNCTVTSLSTLFVVARIYVRIKIVKKFQLDDWLILVSLVCGWLIVACSITSVASGNGKHVSSLNDKQMSGAILWTMVGFIPGVLSFGIPKLAAVALLTRLLNPSRMHQIFLWTMSSCSLLALIAFVGILFGQCTPSRAQWDLSITEKTCIDRSILVNYNIFTGAFTCLVDLYLAIYPAIVLYSLQINTKKKLALCVALGLGSGACIVSIYKTSRVPGLGSPDLTYDVTPLAIWTCVEGSTIIIATCIPILWPLADVLFGRRAMGSCSQVRHRYDHYGTERGNNTIDDFEMGPKRRKVQHPYDLDTYIEAGKNSSQDNIILKDGSNSLGKHPNGIMRTQSVTIFYDDGAGQLKKPEGWK
ncbi:hypothetical protein F4677DRAFT_465480 [Hypoxylon crocopeplum]|nr:hypothetical protein F4677DRAFT_465480 [Hypoxylon crocopeplum]